MYFANHQPKTKQQHIEEFVVVADNKSVTSLLGAGATQRLGLISVHLDHIRTVKHEQTPPDSFKLLTTTDTTSDLKNLLATYADVFDSSAVGQLSGMLHLDVEPTVPPVKMPLRKMPIAIQAQLKDELQRLERLDVIERVNTPTEWIYIYIYIYIYIASSPSRSRTENPACASIPSP